MRFPATQSAVAPGRRAPSLTHGSIDPEVIRLIPRHVAVRHEVVPLARENGSLHLAMVNPGDVIALDELRRLTGCFCRPQVFSRAEVQQAITRYYADEDEGNGGAMVGGAAQILGHEADLPAASLTGAEGDEGDSEHILALGVGADAGEAVSIRLVNQILEQAIAQRVSDVHLEPHEKRTTRLGGAAQVENDLQ